MEYDIDALIAYQKERTTDDNPFEQQIAYILDLHNPMIPIDGHCPRCNSKEIYVLEEYVDYDYEDNMSLETRKIQGDQCLSCGQLLKESWE